MVAFQSADVVSASCAFITIGSSDTPSSRVEDQTPVVVVRMALVYNGTTIYAV